MKSRPEFIRCEKQKMGLLLALSPLALQSSVMSEKGTSFMPHYQIRRVGLLRAEMRMAYVRFSDFVSLVRSAAKKHLNCGLRPEEQDPNDLQRFMRMVHQCQPGFSKKYEDSWPIMAYLEIYLLSRIRTATYLKRHFGRCKEGFVRCPDPIWQRYAEAKKTGASFKRNCQATTKVHYGPKKPTKPSRPCERRAQNGGNGPIKKVYPLKNRVSVVVKKLHKESDVIPISDCASDAGSEADARPPSPFPSPPSLPRVIVPLRTDPVLDFLSSVKPNLADFHSHFVDMGFVDDNALNAFFSWPVDVQEGMMRTQLGGTMNALQLQGLLVAMRARRESV